MNHTNNSKQVNQKQNKKQGKHACELQLYEVQKQLKLSGNAESQADLLN